MANPPVNIPFNRPAAVPAALDYLEQVLASGHLSGDGEFTARASALLSARLDDAPVLLTPSCTHALEMAALLLGIGPGDEVVMPSITFPSTATAFALRGARPVFADVDPGTWCMGPEQAAEVLTERTRAVVAVHYGGVGCAPDALADLCQARGIVLVEDAAQGLFATWRGRPLGTFGGLGALSFHETKNVTSGEGGALILQDRSLLRRAEILREKGTDRALFKRGEVDKYTWRDVGSSWVPSELQAALLTAQLEAAEGIQTHRVALWEAYEAMLRPHANRLGIRLQAIPPEAVHPAHLFGLLVPRPGDRPTLLRRLRQASIQATSHFEPLHTAPASADAPRLRLPVTEDVAPRLLRLPLHTSMTLDDAQRVADTLIAALENPP